MIGRLNEQIINSIIKEINEEATKDNMGIEKSILIKELELSKDLYLDNILDLFKVLLNDTIQNKIILSLSKEEEKELINNINSQNEIEEKDVKSFEYSLKEFDSTIPSELFFDRITNLINNSHLIRLEEIPNIKTDLIQKTIGNIKDIQLELKKELKKINVNKNTILDYKNKLLLEQQKLMEYILEYTKIKMYEYLKSNNFEDASILCINNYKELYKRFNKMISNERISNNVDDIKELKGNEIKTISKEKFIELKAKQNLLNRLNRHCTKYNQEMCAKERKNR